MQEKGVDPFDPDEWYETGSIGQRSRIYPMGDFAYHIRKKPKKKK